MKRKWPKCSTSGGKKKILFDDQKIYFTTGIREYHLMIEFEVY